MEKASKIMRKSVHTYLQHYHHFAWSAAFLFLPFSASVLLSQAFHPLSSPVVQAVRSRLLLLWDAAGFPRSSAFFSILGFKLSQTVASSMITMPFSLSFLPMGKAFVIQTLQWKQPPSSFFQIHIYQPILLTHVCSWFVMLSANAAALSVIFLSFNFLDALEISNPNTVLLLSAASAILYSVILANALVVCNLAVVLAGTERSCSGFLAILKACVLMQGRTSTALSLVLPTNLGLAAIESLFQYRVVRLYQSMHGRISPSFAWEVPLIAYLYSIVIILDTVMGCLFYRSCSDQRQPFFPGEICSQEEENKNTANWKDLQKNCLEQISTL